MTPALDVSFMLNEIHNSPQDSMRHATLTPATKLFVFPFSFYIGFCLCLSLTLTRTHYLPVL